MPRFQNKPRLIEANQFLGEPGVPGVEERWEMVEPTDAPPGFQNEAYLARLYFVTTMQGQKVTVKPGEWIVLESDRVHYYPIADAEFRRLYEPVTE